MEQPWESWAFDLEMEEEKDVLELELEVCGTEEEEEFLRDILWEPSTVSSESESQPNSVQNVQSEEGNNNNGSEIIRPTPRTFILSFDNSTILPATAHQSHSHQQRASAKRSSYSKSTSSSRKRPLESQPKVRAAAASAAAKNNTSASNSLDHIMAERKRRQELTQRFIALSATIPGLKKTDKSSILGEAIKYVKELKERVTELEQRNKRARESTIILKKSDDIDVYAYEDSTTTSSETNSEDCSRPRERETLPDVGARVMENDVLIEIHCEKEEGVELRIWDHLENLHLSVTASSVLPFGNSTLGITAVAQMGDAHRITASDLVKTLRQVLLNHT